MNEYLLNAPVLAWFNKNTVSHLRLPFSFFLMPVFLFALSQVNHIDWLKTILAFIILHILVFPSSNGYNSHQDRDETSIGGLRNPPKVTAKLYYATLLMDSLALLAGLIISIYFSLLLFGFIIMSRAYSYRKVRLKKYPVTGFFVVFVFQGAYIYFMSLASMNNFNGVELFSVGSVICMAISSLFIGSIYPLTQIYQHEADKNDGVISLSYMLGYTGTFVFSGILYAIATLLLFYHLKMKNQPLAIAIFLVMMLPVIYRLGVWFAKVRKNTKHADFDNTMAMNLLTSVIMNLYFLILILNRYENWF